MLKWSKTKEAKIKLVIYLINSWVWNLLLAKINVSRVDSDERSANNSHIWQLSPSLKKSVLDQPKERPKTMHTQKLLNSCTVIWWNTCKMYHCLSINTSIQTYSLPELIYTEGTVIRISQRIVLRCQSIIFLYCLVVRKWK